MKIKFPFVLIILLSFLAELVTPLKAGFKWDIPGSGVITAEAYCSFLTALAASDSNDFYDEKMEVVNDCIIRTGTPGDYVYEVIPGRADVPLSFLSWNAVIEYSEWKGASQQFAQSLEEGSRNIDPSLRSNQLTFCLVNKNTAMCQVGEPEDSVIEGPLAEVVEDLLVLSTTSLGIGTAGRTFSSERREGQIDHLNRSGRNDSQRVGLITEEPGHEPTRQVSVAITDPERHDSIGSNTSNFSNSSFSIGALGNTFWNMASRIRDSIEGIRNNGEDTPSYTDLRTVIPKENRRLSFGGASESSELDTVSPSLSKESFQSNASSTFSIFDYLRLLAIQQRGEGESSTFLSQCCFCCPAAINCFHPKQEESSTIREPLLNSGDEERIERYSTEMTEQPSLQLDDNVVHALKRDAINARGYLRLSAEEYRIIAGESRGWVSATFNRLVKQLDNYKDNKEVWSISEKENALKQLEATVDTYLATRENSLERNPTPEKKERIDARINANKLLKQGIAVEKFALRYDPLCFRFKPESIAASSPCFKEGAMSQVGFVKFFTHRPRVSKQIKEDQQMNSIVAAKMGIPVDSVMTANLAGRAIATFQLSKLLKLKVVPETTLTFLHGGIPTFCQLYVPGKSLFKESVRKLTTQKISQELKKRFAKNEKNLETSVRDHLRESIIQAATNASDGCFPENWKLLFDPPLTWSSDKNHLCENGIPITRERASELFNEGKLTFGKKVTSEVADDIVFSNPTLQKSLSDAYIVNLLSGQLDQHAGNFIFEKSDQGWFAYLIDCDLSFPSEFKTLSPDQLAFIGGSVLLKLPRLIDKQTANEVLDLTPESLRKQLAGTALDESELVATEGRLHDLQQHIRNIKEGKVPGGQLVTRWDIKTYYCLLQKVDGHHHNYVSRCREDLDIKKGEMYGY